ncbi:MAG: ABC transporter permease [Acidobacteriota bacterium]
MRLFGRNRFEARMAAELQFHVDAYVEDLVRAGVNRPEAERRARIEFGSVAGKKDECRQAWGYQWIDDLGADVRLTVRMLWRSRGFAAVAILSLALGIGANTTIFGLVDAVILRVLPAREPNRLVFLQVAGTDGPNGGPPYPGFELFRDRTTSFDGVAAFSASNLELVIDASREQVRGLWVSGNFYDVLGIKPFLGRALKASDDQILGRGGPDGPVAVISRAYWQQRFGSDTSVVGRSIRMFDQTVTIVGVMPAEAMSPEPGRPIDIAVPMMLSNPASLRDRGDWWLDVIARLKPGGRIEPAQAETNALFQTFMADAQMPPAIRALSFDHVEITPAARGLDRLRRQYASPLTALMILAGLVLVAASANVANLMLARATAREREFAVRLAIGAGRARLVRQTLAEAMVLVSVAAVLGIGFAVQAGHALAAFVAEGNRPVLLNLSVNPRVLLYTLAVSLLTGMGFAVLPAIRASRVNPARGLQCGSRSVAGNRRALRVGRVLVITQVCISTVVLAGAGLFIRTMNQLHSVELGFAPTGMLTMEVTPEQQWFGKPAWLAMQADILGRLHAMPEVRVASWSTMSPLSGRNRGTGFYVPGFVSQTPRGDEIHLISVSPEYFDTFGMHLAAGRGFTLTDGPQGPKVAILNKTAAHFYFGDHNPIGARVGFSREHESDYEVVGVVQDAKHDSLRAPAGRFVYLAIPQSVDRINRLALSVRGPGDAGALAASVQREVHSAGPALLITNVSTMQAQIDQSLVTERLVSSLAVAFGALALVLATIGIYGLLAYSVARRTNEFGIRMALGATSGGMLWLVLREALLLAFAGVVFGVPGAVGLGRVTRALLYGVEPFDFASVAGAVLLLLVVAAIAGTVPARRASRMNPVKALRSD